MGVSLCVCVQEWVTEEWNACSGVNKERAIKKSLLASARESTGTGTKICTDFKTNIAAAVFVFLPAFIRPICRFCPLLRSRPISCLFFPRRCFVCVLLHSCAVCAHYGGIHFYSVRPQRRHAEGLASRARRPKQKWDFWKFPSTVLGCNITQ